MGNLAIVVAGVTINDPDNLLPPDATDGIVDNGTLIVIDMADPLCGVGSGGLAPGQAIPNIVIGGAQAVVGTPGATTLSPVSSAGSPVASSGTGGVVFAGAGANGPISLSGLSASLVPTACTSYGAAAWIKINAPLPADGGNNEAIMACSEAPNDPASDQGMIGYSGTTGQLFVSALAMEAYLGAPVTGALIQIGFAASLIGADLWQLQGYLNGVPVGELLTTTAAGGVPWTPNVPWFIGAAQSGALPNLHFNFYRAWVERFDNSFSTPSEFFAADWQQNYGRTIQPFS